MDATMEIVEHMEVVGSDGRHIGTVDYIEGGERIMLTRDDAPDGQHHSVPSKWVDFVDDQVHLNRPAADAIGSFR